MNIEWECVDDQRRIYTGDVDRFRALVSMSTDGRRWHWSVIDRMSTRLIGSDHCGTRRLAEAYIDECITEARRKPAAA